MSISEERALVTEIEDRLIELYVRQDEVRRAKDRERARELQIEIDQVRAQREEMRRDALRIAVTSGPGGLEMAKARERTQKRHVREKSTIDHLVRDVYEKAPDEEHTPRSPTTSTGLPVEDQVRKEWDPRRGGLPTF